MYFINIWIILDVLTILLLIKYFRSKNAVWGGFTMGIIIGLVVSLFYLFKGSGFVWTIIGKGAIIGTLAGFVVELLGKIFDKKQ